MQHGEHHDHIALDSEIQCVGEAAQQSASDSRPQVLILQRGIGYSVVRRTQFGEELLLGVARHVRERHPVARAR